MSCHAMPLHTLPCLLRSAPHAGDGGSGEPSSNSGDLDLAVSCWWRASALQALSAYVLGVMGRGLAEDAAQQVSSPGAVEKQW